LSKIHKYLNKLTFNEKAENYVAEEKGFLNKTKSRTEWNNLYRLFIKL